MKEESEFESIKNEAIEQLKAGKSLVGKEVLSLPYWKVS